jgi:hypothetical protein
MSKTSSEGEWREYYKDIVSLLEHTWQRLRAKKRINGIPLQLPKIEQNQLPADCGHPLRRRTNTTKKRVNCQTKLHL